MNFEHYVNPAFLYTKLYDISEAIKNGSKNIIGEKNARIFMNLGKTEHKSVKLNAGLIAADIKQDVMFYKKERLTVSQIHSLEVFYNKFDFNPDEAFVSGFYVQAVPHLEEEDIFKSNKKQNVNADSVFTDNSSNFSNVLSSLTIPVVEKTKIKRIKQYDKRFR